MPTPFWREHVKCLRRSLFAVTVEGDGAHTSLAHGWDMLVWEVARKHLSLPSQEDTQRFADELKDGDEWTLDGFGNPHWFTFKHEDGTVTVTRITT